MKLKHLHLHAHFRAICMAMALFAAPLSMSVYGQTTYSVVFSNSKDFTTKVEVPMVAALYRDDKEVSVRHTKDNNRWQISLKYDDPRWKDIPDGTVYWYIKSSGGGIIGPNTNGENMDKGTDNSNSSASVHGRMFYKNVTSLKSDGTESSFTYFTCTKGKNSAVSCTFAYSNENAEYESSSNNGSQLTYGKPGVQYWRNLSGIKYSLTYNSSSSSSFGDLPFYDGTFCYVKKPAGWSKVYAWVYDDNKNQYSSVTSWPGEELKTTAESNGVTYYLWKMGSDKTGTPTKIIFNDGGRNQTTKDGWTFTSGAVYDASKSSDYQLGTVKKHSDASDPTATYEKFYAYGFWGGTDASFKEMTPVVYYNDKNEVDSVVYYTTMSNVKASFDNFFFMFCSQRYMESWDKWMTNDGRGAWDFVWRPEIFDNRDCNTLSGALYQPGNDLSNVKGTQSGASYFTGSPNTLNFKTKDDWMGQNQKQSINPLLTPEQKQKYDSYTLSLNVTTGTYNIAFHNAIQIVGPAVASGEDWTVNDSRTYTSTKDKICGSWDKTKAITLKPSDDGTYYYTTVKLKAGEKFRFIENNKYLTNFGEDDVTPNDKDFAPAKENGDVCYYNHISRNTLSTDVNPTDNSGDSGLKDGNDITFTMPGLNAGDTYETEIRVSASNAFDQQMTGKAAPFYTITRPVKLFNYGSDGNGYTSFACNYPLEIVNGTDVKVYDIISYDMNANKVTLRDQSDNYKTSSKQYIPAKSGVVLCASASGATDHVSTITVRPMIEKLGETVDNESNLLKAVYLPGQTINMTLPVEAKNTGDPVTSRQYLFSWVKQSNDSYKLGFLRSKTGTSVSERAYLSLTGEAVGAPTFNPSDQAAYERVEGISTDNETVFGAKEYQVNLFFEGSEDEAITGIHAINNQIVDKEGYYTLQGIRLDKPTGAGIYIHNGKKVIVK